MTNDTCLDTVLVLQAMDIANLLNDTDCNRPRKQPVIDTFTVAYTL